MFNLQEALKEHFDFEHFLEGQEEVIQHLFKGNDLLVVMPTGSGKSLCYQLPALMLEGVSLVISPLIALMKDQVDSLTQKSLPATFVNSTLNSSEFQKRLKGIAQKKYKLVYVAPERFRDDRFCNLLNGLDLKLIAIDEAHCISQWGHDFRPDYLLLRKLSKEWPQTRIMALTATATPLVKEDIIRQLDLGQGNREKPISLTFGFSRPNLKISVNQSSSHFEKLESVLDSIKKYKTGIIYCATRKQVKKVHEELTDIGIQALMYHGGLEESEREKSQNTFIGRKINLVVATNAFGMGIDRDDVRFVTHWDIPGSLEAYYQEIGRSGRDGEDAHCELLYNYADVRTQQFFLEGANPSRQLVQDVWNTLKQKCRHGSVTLSAKEWKEELPRVKNDMAVNSSLYLLARAGWIERELKPGSRIYTYSLESEQDPKAMEEIFSGMSEKLNRDKEKLKTIIRYANSVKCRHRFILNYFGEKVSLPHCDMCDNCIAKSQPELELDEEEWIAVQKVLSCVARMKGRFGKTRVAQTLKGSKSQPVLDAGLDRLSTHGILSDQSEKYIKQVIDALIKDRSIAVSEGDYPKIYITERGEKVMWRKASSSVKIPKPSTEKKIIASLTEEGIEAQEEFDTPLYERLRTWRNSEALARRTPAYLVLTDKSLRSIAYQRPLSHADLEKIWGMGEYKIQQFGDAILDLVDQV